MAALRSPLAGPPLADRVRSGDHVAVVFPDLTRPMPNRTVLPPLLAELARAGVPDDHITLLCATGTHRQASPAEMEELIGADVLARYALVDHDATSDAHLPVGEVDGTPILLQREYVEADVRIVTGFVEPHFFAGFSGGPKGVCPGLAATETILEAHHPRRIADARSTFVTRAGNPVHDFVRAAAALAPPDLSVDVAINRARRVTAVFAGPLPTRTTPPVRTSEASAVRRVDAPFDLVVSTNGGYPLDRNLYQSVKGMAAAERIVRDEGIVIMAAACEDGVPAGGAFARLLGGATTPAELIGAAGRSRAGPMAGPGSGPGAGAGRGAALQRRPRRRHHRGRLAGAGAGSRRRSGGGARTPRARGAGGCHPRRTAHGGHRGGVGLRKPPLRRPNAPDLT